jgi:hypothetical protein
MSKTIYEIVDALPAKSMTTRLLGALDWVVPGEWKNIVGFENTIREVTGETDEKFIQKIGERAVALYNDKSQGYQTALWLYQTVNTEQGVAGTAAMVNKVGESFSFLSLFKKLTPKADTTQTVDLAIKLGVEIIAFTKINGIPGDGVADFIKSLSDYRFEALMRMAALVCVDGMIPLGPDFLSKALGMFQKTGASDLASSDKFKAVSSLIPGANVAEQANFLQRGLKGVEGWVGSFISQRDLSVDKIVGNLKKYIDGIEGKLDYVAAFLDMTTNYYEHTGTQSIARSLISRAAGEI